MGNNNHWIMRGLEGVNVITLIVLLLGGAKLYFDLGKRHRPVEERHRLDRAHVVIDSTATERRATAELFAGLRTELEQMV